jgi:hypothetical protein
MRAMSRWWILVVALSAGCGSGSGGCGIGFGAGGPPPTNDAAATPTVPHGDHSPHHGGVVMMKGDLHYEVVFDPSGKYALYFSDATRADLPATTAALASVTVMRPDAPPEGVSLAIDEAGESWIGGGKPVDKPDDTKVRVAYTIRGEEPYWIDLPFKPQPTVANPH